MTNELNMGLEPIIDLIWTEEESEADVGAFTASANLCPGGGGGPTCTTCGSSTSPSRLGYRLPLISCC